MDPPWADGPDWWMTGKEERTHYEGVSMRDSNGIPIPCDQADKIEALRVSHSHRSPDEKAQRLLRDLRQRFLDMAVAIEELLPPSREKSLVQTKLDEARMWACSAAVAGGEIRETLTVNHPLPIE